MRNPIKPLMLCLFSLLWLSPVLAADLKTYKDVYQKNTEEIRQTFQPKFADLQQQYQKSLTALKNLAQNQGDLKKTKAAIAELDRFQKAKCLPATPDDSEIPEIKAFQSTYVKQFTQLETDLTANLGTLTTKYVQVLDRLQKELVKAGKLDDATAVQEERDKAQAELKGYADQFSTLTGAAATNASPVAASQAPAPTAGKAVSKKDQYLVVDLSHGTKAKNYPVATLADVPKKGWTDEYKTDKLVLRKIEPGTFIMGSPEDEVGRKDDEKQHEVTLTKGFYIGVFEVTQKQWERVMGTWPSQFSNVKYRDTRPVENVKHIDIRGSDTGANWPATNSVDMASFLGRLRARTGKEFDLPTEAQWEYACRAGTTTALNSGKALTDVKRCTNLSEVGRHKGNSRDPQEWAGNTSGGTAKAGTYLPNTWGLYDLHGNVWEWCLDWSGKYSGAESDPKGATTGFRHVIRGGAGDCDSVRCRSAERNSMAPDVRMYNCGFRVVMPTDQQ